MKKIMYSVILIIAAAILSAPILSSNVHAAGISIDAGLTPPQKRWIFRSQVRFMQRTNDPTPMGREMKMYMFPAVVAYGLRPDLTLMVRQAAGRSEMLMNGNSDSQSGLADLFVLAKFRMSRINTASYTIGMAPTIGLEMPTGQDGFTSDSWDPHLGYFISGRSGPWGLDLNALYVWNGMAKTGDSDSEPGDEFSLDAAFAYQYGFGDDAEYAFAPVVELSYKKINSNSINDIIVENTGESFFQLSPGFKFTRSSFIVESLLQLPVWQDQEGIQTERDIGFLVGLRFMY
ncbi:MAG: transporter [Candidatus Zixiibacteriota bacterium]|nr:MAG: transporter [candidate division Zixibacteria bacterium]